MDPGWIVRTWTWLESDADLHAEELDLVLPDPHRKDQPGMLKRS